MADIITVDDVKESLEMKGTDSDASLTLLVNAVSDYIKRECGSDFEVAAHTEYLDGTGMESIFPDNPPIGSVVSITDTDISRVYLTTEYVVYPNKITLKSGLVFAKGYQNITIVYTGGESIGDVKQAAVMIATAWWRRRRVYGKSSDGGTQGSQISIGSDDIPPEARKIITKRVNWAKCLRVT